MIAVAGPDGAEVAAVQGDDVLDIQPLGQRHNRGIDGTKREVGVLVNERGDPGPIFSHGRLDSESVEPADEGGLRVGAQSALEKVRDLARD